MRACRTTPYGSIDASWGDTRWRNLVQRTPVGNKTRIEICERSSRRGLDPGASWAHGMLSNSCDRSHPLVVAVWTAPSNPFPAARGYVVRTECVSGIPEADKLWVGLDEGNSRAPCTARTSPSATRIRSRVDGTAPLVSTTAAHPPCPVHAGWPYVVRTTVILRGMPFGSRFRKEVREGSAWSGNPTGTGRTTTSPCASIYSRLPCVFAKTTTPPGSIIGPRTNI